MDYEFETAFKIAIFLFLIIVPISIFLKGTEKLVIHRDYYNEYLETQQELNKLKEVREIQCQPVQCKQGGAGIAFGIFGIFFYIGGLLFFTWQQKKLNKKEEELKERENALKRKRL